MSGGVKLATIRLGPSPASIERITLEYADWFDRARTPPRCARSLWRRSPRKFKCG